MSDGVEVGVGDGMDDGVEVVQRPRCSAKDCRSDATTDLEWRNPTLHGTARVKHWLACDDHADFLADFLSRRGFLLTRGPLEREPGPTER